MKKRLSLGDKIRNARTTAKLSQKELGEKIELTDKAVSAYEVGRAQPSVEVLRDIGTATGRPVTYFIDDEKSDEIDLAMRIKSIEKELADIKKELLRKGYDLQ
jgi:transcriptional regulator with XRE-family HTH domain